MANIQNALQPQLASPSPDNDNHPTVIIIVFISFGCLFFLAPCVLSLCWFLWRRKNRSKHVKEAGILHIDEHEKVKEAIIEGPHGTKAVVLEMEDDVHIGEAAVVIVNKDEKLGSGSDTIVEMGTSYSSSGTGHDHHRLEDKA